MQKVIRKIFLHKKLCRSTFYSAAARFLRNYAALCCFSNFYIQKTKKILAKFIRVSSHFSCNYAAFSKIKYAAAAESISSIETTQEDICLHHKQNKFFFMKYSKSCF